MERSHQPAVIAAPQHHPLASSAFEEAAVQEGASLTPPVFQLHASPAAPPPEDGAEEGPIQRQVALPGLLRDNATASGEDPLLRYAPIVLSAVSSILDPEITPENRAAILNREGPNHPENYREALGEAGAEYFAALWDFWNARWQSPNRGARNACLNRGWGRIQPFMEARLASRLYPGRDNRTIRAQFIELRRTEITEGIRAVRRVRGSQIIYRHGPPPAPAATAATESSGSSQSQSGSGQTARRRRRAVPTVRPLRRTGGGGRRLSRAQTVNPEAESRTGEVSLEEIRNARSEFVVSTAPADTLLWLAEDIICLMGSGRTELFPQLMGPRHNGLLYQRNRVNLNLHTAQENRTSLQARIAPITAVAEADRTRRQNRRLERWQGQLNEANSQITTLTAQRNELDTQIRAAAVTERAAALAYFRDARRRLIARVGEIQGTNPDDIDPRHRYRVHRLLISWIDASNRNRAYNALDWSVFLYKIDRGIQLLTQTPAEGAWDPLLREYPRQTVTSHLRYTRGGRVTLTPVRPGTLVDHPDGFHNGGASYHAGLPEQAVNEAMTSAQEHRANNSGEARDRVLQPVHRETALTILYTFQHLEGTPTSMNTWDSADLTAASGIAARGPLEHMMADLKRDHPQEFRNLFGRFGIDVYHNRSANHYALSIRIPEDRQIGRHHVTAGTVLRGEQAIQYIINDPVILLQLRRAGHSAVYQRQALDHALNSMRTALIRECRNDIPWGQVLSTCPDETVRAEATFAVTNEIHASNGLGNANARVPRSADLNTPEGAQAACAGAIESMVRIRHRRRRLARFRAVRAGRIAAQQQAAQASQQEQGGDSSE